MPKLDLTRARRIKVAAGEVLRLKGVGFTWSAPVKPTLTVTGSPAVTTFARGGISYTQVLWSTAGSFDASAPIAGLQYALGGGGASGGALSNAGGGGGAGAVIQGVVTLATGAHSITLGAGGVGVINAAGTNGSPSTISGPTISVSAPGGGQGGSTQNGGNGGCGGGGGTNGTSRAGGTGSVGGNGGASVAGAATAERAAGGGGGMGGNGVSAIPSVGGAGGAGITLAWTEPPMQVAGGGGGTANSGVYGSASHGGTAGNRAGRSLDATLSGGSGGSGGPGGYQSGAGGNGFAVLVFPSANANVVQA